MANLFSSDKWVHLFNGKINRAFPLENASNSTHEFMYNKQCHEKNLAQKIPIAYIQGFNICLNKTCAIEGCTHSHIQGFKTCAIESCTQLSLINYTGSVK